VAWTPVTVLAFAGAAGLLVATDTTFAAVFGDGRGGVLGHLLGMLFHRSADHYRGNMLVFVPFGVVLTALTSDRHVFALVVLTHLPASAVYAAVGGGIVGSSIAAMGVASATLVRTVGEGMQDTSMEWLQAVLLGILAPFLLALFVVAVVGVPSGVAHVGHFLGFLFGAAYEATLVLTEHSHAAVLDRS
jgi:membrane associated rhomboid family serine protease